MNEHSKIPLDYSALADERRRDTQRERERREALERYNESTFGERHPFGYFVLRRAALVLILLPVLWFLPRWSGRLVVIAAYVSVVIWEKVRYRD